METFDFESNVIQIDSNLFLMSRITCKEAPNFFYSELLTQKTEKKDECHDQAQRPAMAKAWPLPRPRRGRCHGQGVADATAMAKAWPLPRPRRGRCHGHGQGVTVAMATCGRCPGQPWPLPRPRRDRCHGQGVAYAETPRHTKATFRSSGTPTHKH